MSSTRSVRSIAIHFLCLFALYLYYSVHILDTKAEANHFLWENDFKHRKRPKKRGRTKANLADLEQELEIKTEKVQRMDTSLKKLQKHVEHQVLQESDLEEFEELLASDEDDSDLETAANENGNFLA